MSTANWTLDEHTLAIIRTVEDVAKRYGAHVALTGGVLYKKGPRKDLDLMFYRIRQSRRIDAEAMFKALETHGFTVEKGRRWVYKAKYQGRGVDFLFPEEKKHNGPAIGSAEGLDYGH